MNVSDLVRLVTEAAAKIHGAIGPGCFETTYEEVLYYELSKKGLLLEREVMMPVLYERLVINDAFKIDMLVDQQLVIEVVAVDKVLPVHFKLVKGYLKLLKLSNGLLINFKTDSLKDGVHRVLSEGGK
ncbi:MAG: GxxExxY protein [Chitinophagaceae bacterium]